MESQELVVGNTKWCLQFSSYAYNGIGRHCCLYCTITHEQMRTPLRERSRSPKRTLQSLNADYNRFCSLGRGDIKNAKHFNNVISENLFGIPISQVKITANT